MKKLFIPGIFLTLFLFFFGCQSESPVQVKQDTTTFEKPAITLQVETEINSGDYVFIAMWNSLGGAKSYKFSYTDPDGNYKLLREYEASGGTKTYTYNSNPAVDVVDWADGTYTFTVKAFNNKGDEMTSAEYSVVYPWIDAVTGISCNFEVGPSGTNINVSWDAYPFTDSYHVMLLDINNNLLAEYTAEAEENSHGFFMAEFSEQSVKVRVDAYNSNGIKIATGTATFINTTFMGTVTGINCDFEAAANGGTNLNVSWDEYAFSDAVYYTANRVSLYNDQVSLGYYQGENNYCSFYTLSFGEDPYVKIVVDVYNLSAVKIATGTAYINVPE